MHSFVQQSIQGAHLLAASYKELVTLMGRNAFMAASKELREYIEEVSETRKISTLRAGAVVIEQLKAGGQSNAVTRMMVRATIFSLFLEGEQTDSKPVSEIINGSQGLN